MKAITIIIFIIIINFIIPVVKAAESSPSADIKAKLEELRKEIASKAASMASKLKQEVANKLKDKAYLGNVTLKSDSSLTITTKLGPKTVNLNQDTEYESFIKTKKKFTQNTISDKDYLVSLGDIDETGVLTAKKIVLLPTPSPKPKTFLWGQVVAVSDDIITIKGKLNKNIAVSLPDPSEVKVSNFVILTGFMGKKEIFEAEFVYVIPQTGVKKIATPSAKLNSL